MERAAFSRYERTGDGRIVIDVAAARSDELYNDFDKRAPYARRDLDRELVDYLIGCAKELRRAPFVIRLTLDHPADDTQQTCIRGSIAAYFLYLAEDERRQVLQMFRRSVVLLFVGLAILSLSVSVNRALGAERSVVANVFAEGLTIAAWLSLWESLAVFLIEWPPHRRNVLLYRRLAKTEINFGPEHGTSPRNAGGLAANSSPHTIRSQEDLS